MRRALLVFGVVFSGFVGVCAAGAAHAAAFDGKWSVLIVTEKGECDKGYRYEVGVGQGRVRYIGDASIDLAGTVAPDGAVRVRISRGSQFADGVGRLSPQSGSGTWRGRTSNGECRGRWEAERR